MKPITAVVEFYADATAPEHSALRAAQHYLFPIIHREILNNLRLFYVRVPDTASDLSLGPDTKFRMEVKLSSTELVGTELLQEASRLLDKSAKIHLDDYLQLRAYEELVAELRKPWYRKLFCRISLLFRKREVTSNC